MARSRKLSQKSPAVASPDSVLTLDRLRAHQAYIKNGIRVPGVTTVIGMMDKPALVRWANRMGLEGKDTSKIVEHAADIGTVTHARIEAFLRGKTLHEGNIAPDVLKASLHGFERFVEWWNGHDFEVVATEKQMVSRKWDVGGTADVIALQRRAQYRVLLDLKTSSGIYKEMRIQACAYADIYEEQPDGRVLEEVWVVRVGKEEGDTIEPVQIMNRKQCTEVFDRMVALYPLWSRLR